MIAGQIQRRNKYLRLLGINIAVILLLFGIMGNITPKGNEVLTGIFTVLLVIAYVAALGILALMFGAYLKAKGYPELGILAIFGPVVWLVFWLLPDKTVGQPDETSNVGREKFIKRISPEFPEVSGKKDFSNIEDLAEAEELVSEYGRVLAECGDKQLTFKPLSLLPGDKTSIQNALKAKLILVIAHNDEKAIETIVVCYMLLADFMRDDIALAANESLLPNAKAKYPDDAWGEMSSQSEVLAHDWNSFLERLSGNDAQMALVESAKVKAYFHYTPREAIPD